MNEQDYLMHYGVKGMKWGVRRYQNPDGTRTSLGRQHEAELKGHTYTGSNSSSTRRSGSGGSTASKIKDALTSDTAKKVYAGVAVAATVAGAAYLYSRNKGAVDSFVKSAASRAASSTRSATSKGKAYMSKAMSKATASARATMDNAKVGFENSGVGKAAKKAVRSVGINTAATADIARNKARNVRSAIKNSQIARNAYGAGQTIKNTAQNTARNAANAARNAGSSVNSAARNTASNIKETARAAKQDYDMNLRGTGRQAVNNAASAVRGAASKVGAAAKNAVTSASRAASKASVSARAAADNARVNIENSDAARVARNVTTKAGSATRNAVSAVRNAASKVGSTAKSATARVNNKTMATNNKIGGRKQYTNADRMTQDAIEDLRRRGLVR